MTSLPTNSIQFIDNDVVIDAELLARCLDLSVATLKKAMNAGCIRTLVENGEGEDLGRMRLTFRYEGKQFSILREPGGQLRETDPPSPDVFSIRPSIMRLMDNRPVSTS